MEMALYSVFLCGLYHRNVPRPNLKHIYFRVCQVGYYFAILVLFDFCVKVFFSVFTLLFKAHLLLTVSNIYFQQRQ